MKSLCDGEDVGGVERNPVTALKTEETLVTALADRRGGRTLVFRHHLEVVGEETLRDVSIDLLPDDCAGSLEIHLKSWLVLMYV